jgi:PAS domain-containing protein
MMIKKPPYEELAQRIVTLEKEVAKQKQLEEALQESEVRYRGIFEHTKNGVAVYKAVNDGEDFIFLDFNKAGEKIDNIYENKPANLGTAYDTTERKQAQELLIERERQLEHQSRNLAEVNTALKVLLKSMEDDRINFNPQITQITLITLTTLRAMRNLQGLIPRSLPRGG